MRLQTCQNFSLRVPNTLTTVSTPKQAQIQFAGEKNNNPSSQSILEWLYEQVAQLFSREPKPVEPKPVDEKRKSLFEQLNATGKMEQVCNQTNSNAFEVSIRLSKWEEALRRSARFNMEDPILKATEKALKEAKKNKELPENKQFDAISTETFKKLFPHGIQKALEKNADETATKDPTWSFLVRALSQHPQLRDSFFYKILYYNQVLENNEPKETYRVRFPGSPYQNNKEKGLIEADFSPKTHAIQNGVDLLYSAYAIMLADKIKPAMEVGAEEYPTYILEHLIGRMAQVARTKDSEGRATFADGNQTRTYSQMKALLENVETAHLILAATPNFRPDHLQEGSLINGMLRFHTRCLYSAVKKRPTSRTAPPTFEVSTLHQGKMETGILTIEDFKKYFAGLSRIRVYEEA